MISPFKTWHVLGVVVLFLVSAEEFAVKPGMLTAWIFGSATTSLFWYLACYYLWIMATYELQKKGAD